MIRVEIGAKLKRLRTEAGLTLVALAEKAKVNAGNLSRIENGKVTPSVDTSTRLANALGIEPARLFEPEEMRQIALVDLGARVLRGATHNRITEPGTIKRYDTTANLLGHTLAGLKPGDDLFEVLGDWPELRFEPGDLLVVSASVSPVQGDTVLIEVSGDFLPFAVKTIELPSGQGLGFSYQPLAQNALRGLRNEPLTLVGLISELRRRRPHILYT